MIGYYELLKIRWCLTMISIVGGDKDLKFYSGFNWEPVQRSRYGGKMVSDLSSSQYTLAFWINRRVFKILMAFMMKCIASVCGSRRWGQNSVYLDLDWKLSEKKSKWCGSALKTSIRDVSLTAAPLQICNNRCITNDLSYQRCKTIQTTVQFAYFITTAGF